MEMEMEHELTRGSHRNVEVCCTSRGCTRGAFSDDRKSEWESTGSGVDERRRWVWHSRRGMQRGHITSGDAIEGA
jgi:hypothetical protein